MRRIDATHSAESTGIIIPGKEINRRVAIQSGTAAFAAMMAWACGCNGTKPKKSDVKHHPEVDALWHKEFEERFGHEWVAAMETNDPKQLQEFVNTQKLQEGLRDEESRILCSDGRNCVCGSCSAGSQALVANPDGSPRALQPDEIAERVLRVPAIMRTGKQDIEYTDHLGCGGRKIAMSLIMRRPIESIKDEELEQWGIQQGEAVVHALNKRLRGSRKAKFAQLRYDNGGMDGIPEAHDEDFIAVTAFNGKQLDRKFPRIPKHMQFDLTSMDERSAILHLRELAKILAGDHGPGHTPIPIVGLSDQQFHSQTVKTFRELEKALPPDLRKQVLLGTAIV